MSEQSRDSLRPRLRSSPSRWPRCRSQRTSAQLDEALPARAVLPTEIPSPQFPVVPSVAPGYRAPEAAPSAAQIIGVTQQPFVGISLQDAIAMALLKNPNLAVSASNVRIARYNIVAIKGNYDCSCSSSPRRTFPSSAAECIRSRPGRAWKIYAGARHDDRSDLHDRPRQHHPAPVGVPVRRRRPDRKRHDATRPAFSRAGPTITPSSMLSIRTTSPRSTSRSRSRC